MKYNLSFISLLVFFIFFVSGVIYIDSNVSYWLFVFGQVENGKVDNSDSAGSTVNSLAKANDLTVTTLKDTPITISLNAAGSDNLTRLVINQPTNGQLGTIEQKTGSIEYKPSKNFVGRDAFSYLVIDGGQGSNVATVTIAVTDSQQGRLIPNLENLVCSNGNPPDAIGKCPDGFPPQPNPTVTSAQANTSAPASTGGQLVCSNGNPPDAIGKCPDGFPPQPNPTVTSAQANTSAPASTGGQLVCSNGNPPDAIGKCPDGFPPQPNPTVTSAQANTSAPASTGGQLVCSNGNPPDAIGKCPDGFPPQPGSNTNLLQRGRNAISSGITSLVTGQQLVCSNGNPPDAIGKCPDGFPPQPSPTVTSAQANTSAPASTGGQLVCSDGKPPNSSGLCFDGTQPQSSSATNIGQPSTTGSSIPVARDLSLTTLKDQPKTVTFSATGSGDLTAHITRQPLKGQLGQINQQTGTVQYTPDNGYVGSDTFRYLVDNGQQGSNVATVTITITRP